MITKNELKQRIAILEAENSNQKAEIHDQKAELEFFRESIQRANNLVGLYRDKKNPEVEKLNDKIKRYEYLVASYRTVVINLTKTIEREREQRSTL